MIEDKLTQSQRIRLEAVAQANASLGAPMAGTLRTAALFDRVSHIERYITDGTKPND